MDSRRTVMVALVVAAAGCSSAEPAAAGDASTERFDGFWSDGRGELDGYDLIQPRYGEERHGRAVLVFVTEPFSRARRVKVDRHDPSDPDQLVVLKLNEIRKFQTGVYDYSLMTSVFTDPHAGFRPLVSRFSSQEWCGHTWDETVLADSVATVRTESYFEGETGTARVDAGDDVLLEDALPIVLRGLDADALTTKPWKGRLLESATRRRLAHHAPGTTPASIVWSEGAMSVDVPAGSFAVREATLTREGGPTCRYRVEVAYPHHLVSWDCDDGERAALTGSERAPYWKQHGEGDERELEKLGLDPMGVAP